MSANHQSSNGNSGLGEAYSQQDKAAIELTNLMQHAEPGDVSLLAKLIDNYGRDILYLSRALLTHLKIGLPSETEVCQVAKQTLFYAIRHKARYRGKIGLRNWLMRIAIRYALKAQPAKQRSPVMKQGHTLTIPEDSLPFWARFEALPKKHRIGLVLRYGCDMRVGDIAEILHMPLKNAQTMLTTIRQQLTLDVPKTHRTEDVEAYLDGVMAADPFTRDELESHLQKCQECEAYLTHMRALEEQIYEELKRVWPPVSLTSPEIDQIIKVVQQALPVRRDRQHGAVSLSKVARTAAMVLFGAALAYLMISQQLQESAFDAFPAISPTTPQKIEQFQEAQATQTTDANENSAGLLSNINLYTYALSDNAEVIAIISTGYDILSQPEDMIVQKVYVYDKKSNKMEEIASSNDEQSEMNWLNSPPSMSADGRYLAYSAMASPRDEDAGDQCRSVDGQACADIYVYDHWLDTTQQITHGLDGAPANGTSFAPQISGDGRWVAFWSMAGNLSADENGSCPNIIEEEPQPCIDFFLVDRQDGMVIRKPVGAMPADGLLDSNRISLSANGRFIAFTVDAHDQLGVELKLRYESQAVLFDRHNGSYRVLNQTADGSYGNGASFGPMISADGRYVAFSSRASNLIEGDTNDAVDVFLLDLQNDTLERVSLGPLGEQGNHDSGVIMEGVGFYSIDISDDGRYVVFTSLASNMGPEVACDTELGICNSILLYDRLSGVSEVIQSIQQASFYLLPQVSSDGRYIAFMELQLDCGYTQGLCLETVLLDRQRGWSYGMIETLFHPVQKVWKETTLIQADSKEVEQLIVSQDGKILVVAYDNETIGVWDFSQEKWVRKLTLPSKTPISSLALTTDATRLAVGTVGGIVYVWELPSGRYLYELADHPGRIHSIEFSSDGNELVVGTPREVWVWRRYGGRIERAYKLEYDTNISSLALGPDDNLMAVGSADHTVWLQLLPSGTVLSRLEGLTSAVIRVTFSRDHQRLAAKSTAGEVRVWNVDWQGFGSIQAELVSTFDNSMLYGDLVFSPDGSSLISGSMYQGIILWDIDNPSMASLYSKERGEAYIKSVAFSSDGITILGGIFGAIDTWSSASIATEPVHFLQYTLEGFNNQLAMGRLQTDDWDEAHLLEGETDSLKDLYVLDQILPFDVMVPARLPEQVHFIEAQILQEGGAVLRYEVSSAGRKIADLYVIERPVEMMNTYRPVVEVGRVEEIDLEEITAEYAQGAWVKVETEEGITQWQWDNAQPTQRLRWNTNSLSLEIYYREEPVESQENTMLPLDSPSSGAVAQPTLGLKKFDLVQIARGVTRLVDSTFTDFLKLSYVVKEGETCSGIASKFGTDISTIASLNGLPEDCSLIYVGQALVLPLIRERMVAGLMDLDCDGQVEQLQVIPVSTSYPQAGAYGVYLQSMTDIGLYGDVWRMTILGEDADILSTPQIVTVHECVNLLALQVIKAEEPHLRFFRWADGQMQLVLDQGVEMLPVNNEQDGLWVREHVHDQVNGACQIWDVNYGWQDGKLIENNRVLYSDGGC